MHIVGAQETLEKRKKGREGWEEEEYSLSIGGLTLIFLSSVFSLLCLKRLMRNVTF